MAEIVWTDEAEQWLLKIHDYIAKDSPATAFNIVRSIYERAQILERFPDLGHGYTSPSGRETRILLWGHYRIVYLKPQRSAYPRRLPRGHGSGPVSGVAKEPPNKRMQQTKPALNWSFAADPRCWADLGNETLE